MVGLGSGAGTGTGDRSAFTSPRAQQLERTICLDMRPGLSAQEADRRAAQAARAGDAGSRVAAYYLVDMAERGVHQEFGYASIVQYGEARLRKDAVTVREYLAVGRALLDLPEIDRALCEERLSYSQVRSLARVATAETESAWLAWAEGRTVREILANTRGREKGELPTDPLKRRIHEITFHVGARLNLVQKSLWDNARAKLEAEMGEPVSDTDMLLEAAMLLLQSGPDGTVPGRSPVNDSHFQVVVHHNERTGATALLTEDGAVELDEEGSCEVLREAGREDLAESMRARARACIPVPAAERDRPTPPHLRRKVLARDGKRCLCCGSKQNLTVDHTEERQCGGPTEESNLGTLCEDCHSLKHAGLLHVHRNGTGKGSGTGTGNSASSGTGTGAPRFSDRSGRDLRQAAAPAGLDLHRHDDHAARAADDARAAFNGRVRFRDVPHHVDADWWARHAHLLLWNDRLGVLEFQPGQAREPLPDVHHDPAARAASGTAAPRPAGLAAVIGQRRVVENLDLAVRASAKLGEPLGHVLLYGGPGLGKTSLSHAIASDLGTGLHMVSAPVLREPGTLLRLLTTLRERDVLFIDEIHRLPARVAEALYEAMEDRRLSLPLACEGWSRTLHVHLRPFTLIGATTDEDLLLPALHSRFQIREHLEPYRTEEIVAIIPARCHDHAPRMVVPERPRRRHRASRAIDEATVQRVLDRLGIDRDGLRPREREYLAILRRSAGAVGLATLAAALGSSKRAVSRILEPYLIRRGLVAITPWGRVAAQPG